MKEIEGIVDDAPSAIPSAAACMTRPKVVEKELFELALVGAEEVLEDRSERE